MRIRPLLGFFALVLGSSSVLLASDVHAQLRRIAIGSNPAGTNYFVVAGGIAKLLQEEAQIPVTVRPFSGSSVYIPMLQRGEIALGINTQLDTYVAYSGLEPYPASMTNLRLLIKLMPILDNYLVRADSDVRTIADLRGRRVITAVRSNVVLERWHLALLATGGLAPGDVEDVSVGNLPGAIRMLTEGRVDAASTGLYSALALQANSTIRGGVRFIGLGREESALFDSVPVAKVDLVEPKSVSVGIREPTRLARFESYLNTGSHISDEDAYRLVKILHEQWESLRRDYALLSSVSSEMTAPADSPHPYHPGAVQYFREAGLWTDAHARNQTQVLRGGGP